MGNASLVVECDIFAKCAKVFGKRVNFFCIAVTLLYTPVVVVVVNRVISRRVDSMAADESCCSNFQLKIQRFHSWHGILVN